MSGSEGAQRAPGPVRGKRGRAARQQRSLSHDEDLTTQQMQQRKGLSSDLLGLKVGGFKPFFRGTTLNYRDAGVVRPCAKGGAHKIRSPTPTVPGPRPAHRPEYTNVAIDPAEVLRQVGVSVSREVDLDQPCLLPWGLTGKFRTVQALQLQFLGLWSPFSTDYLAFRSTMLMIALLFMCRCDFWVRGLLLFWPGRGMGLSISICIIDPWAQ